MHKSLQWLVREALVECADDSQSNLIQATPVFENEPRELANILDYVLVDWPENLQYVIRTRYDRALFRRYAKNAQTALEDALNFVSNRFHFGVAVKETWMRRFQTYTNNHNAYFPYIHYRYTVGRGLHVQNMCLIQNAQNFSDPNSQVPRSVSLEFLKIHDAESASVTCYTTMISTSYQFSKMMFWIS